MKKIQKKQLIITITSLLVAYPLIAIATELSQPVPNYLRDLHEFAATEPATPSLPLWHITKPSKPLPENAYAEILDWIPSPDNLCRGYYKEPAIVTRYPHPEDPRSEETTITATLPSLLSESGVSVLQGNVTVTQPGREITADKGYLYRDAKTRKITAIDMVGNVHIRENGQLLVANKIHINLADNTVQLESGVYRFSKTVEGALLNAWGTLKRGQRESSGVLILNHATYSTCPPTSNTWRVIAERLHLDREKGEGTATNTWLEVKDIPVVYVPYFTFPIDNRRKSGFLFPTYGFTNPGGMYFSIPYYLNLAPNYDATITPNVYTQRGLQGSLQFRYLTDVDNGSFNISVLPDDQTFKKFKETAAAQYAGIPNEDVYLDQLDKTSNTRTYVSYADNAIFNPHWSSNVNLNYVNDDYYFKDFGSTPAVVAADQLLNQGNVQYQGNNWNFLARLQAFETLHPINDQFTENQYARLPELDLNADYPDQPFGFDYQLLSQFVYFDHQRDFITGDPVVTGERYNFAPSISWPMANMSGYFDPKLQLESTYYDLKNQVPTFAKDISRVLPIFDIDTGLFFDRHFHLFNGNYRETLEPRLFYLYVPNKQQDEIPLFDTTLPPFSYEQMFQTNRFTGIDRIGDANQLTAALTTRFLNSDNGEEKLRASVGEILLFQQHQVNCFDQGIGNCVPDPTRGKNLSPVVGELSYNLNPAWNVTSDLAIQPYATRIDNGNVNVIYNYGKRLFNIGYYFVRNADIQDQTLSVLGQPPITAPPAEEQENVNRLNLGFSLPITEHWSALADVNYNIGTNHSQLYVYGAQYESCCWATRFVISRTLASIDQLGRAQFNTAYYIQFQLKGLANFGYNNPSGLLTSVLPGYKDQFQTGFNPLTPNI